MSIQSSNKSPSRSLILLLVTVASIDSEFSRSELAFIKRLAEFYFPSETVDQEIQEAMQLWQNSVPTDVITAALEIINKKELREILCMHVVDLILEDGSVQDSEYAFLQQILDESGVSKTYKNSINTICKTKCSDWNKSMYWTV